MPSIGSTTQVSPLRARRAALLLAHDGVVGSLLASSREDQLLAALVHHGHRVGVGRLRGDRAGRRALVDDQPARRPGPPGRRPARARRGRRRRAARMPSPSVARRTAPASRCAGWGSSRARRPRDARHRAARSRARPPRRGPRRRARASRSTSPSTNTRRCRVSAPARTAPRPARRSRRPRCRGRARPPCGRRRTDRGAHDRDARRRAELLDPVVDVGLEPRLGRRTGARAEHQLALELQAQLAVDLVGEPAARRTCWSA